MLLPQHFIDNMNILSMYYVDMPRPFIAELSCVITVMHILFSFPFPSNAIHQLYTSGAKNLNAPQRTKI